MNEKKTILVTGTVLVDAPLSALNNSGTAKGQATQNTMKVKAFQKNGTMYPYVSGQAFKRWWRDTLVETTGWTPSPIVRQGTGEKQQAYTQSDPVTYEEDDLFGYMKAVKPFTFKRIAPLKVSPLVAVEPFRPHHDFGVFARDNEDDKEKSNPAIYEQQLYSSILRGSFSIFASAVGCFKLGEGFELPYENMTPKKDDKKEAKTNAKLKKEEEEFVNERDEIWNKIRKVKCIVDQMYVRLPNELRSVRTQRAIESLAYLFGGAKLTNYLTDVVPKAVVAAPLTIANHIFLYVLSAKDGKPYMDTEVLKDVLGDYKDAIANKKLYIGIRQGFFSDEEYKKAKEFKYEGIDIIFGTPKFVLESLAKDTAAIIKDRKLEVEA